MSVSEYHVFPLSCKSKSVVNVSYFAQLLSNHTRVSHIFHRMNILSILHNIFRKKSGTVVDTTPQRGISLPRYMGRWYEQARYENWFESGMDFVYTDYSSGPDGSINVINCGTSLTGKQSVSTGRGFPGGFGRMRISFVPPYGWFQAPYHILYVDNNYETALVSGEGDAYLWLLTRQQHPGPDQLNPLIQEAQRRGFDTTQLRYTNQIQ